MLLTLISKNMKSIEKDSNEIEMNSTRLISLKYIQSNKANKFRETKDRIKYKMFLL